MKTVTTYFSDDGKAFNTEEECRAYERLAEFQGKDDIISGLDKRGNLIKFPSDEDFCESVMVVQLKNKEAVNLFRNRCEYEGFECNGIFEPGIYVWGEFINDQDCDWWLLAEDIIQKHQRIIDKVEGCKAKFSLE